MRRKAPRAPAPSCPSARSGRSLACSRPLARETGAMTRGTARREIALALIASHEHHLVLLGGARVAAHELDRVESRHERVDFRGARSLFGNDNRIALGLDSR